MMEIIQSQNMQLLLDHPDNPVQESLQKLEINQELLKNYSYIFQNLIEQCTLQSQSHPEKDESRESQEAVDCKSKKVKLSPSA